MPHRYLPRCLISDLQQISLLEVLLRTKVNLDRLMQSERHYTSAAGSTICRRVMIRSEPPSLMANYSKSKRVKPPWSCIATVGEGNWNLEKWEGIEEVETETGKLRREAARSVMNIEWDYNYYQPWSDNEWLVDEMLAMLDEDIIMQ